MKRQSYGGNADAVQGLIREQDNWLFTYSTTRTTEMKMRFQHRIVSGRTSRQTGEKLAEYTDFRGSEALK